jgi:tetratricopeptide (TPR) repeat protein
MSVPDKQVSARSVAPILHKKNRAASAPAPRRDGTTTLLIVLSLAALATIVLALLAFVKPDWRLWSVHSLAFIPRPAAIALLAAAALLLSPALQSRAAQIGRILIQPLNKIPAPVLAIGAGMFFYWQAVPAPLLGDGQLWLNEIATVQRTDSALDAPPQTRSRQLRKEPLETLIHDWATQALLPFYPPTDLAPPAVILLERAQRFQADENRLKRAAAQSFRILSALAGVLFVWMIVRFARAMLPAGNRALFMLLVLGTSSMLLFFGYVEHYSWVSLASMACLLSGIHALETKSLSWLPLALAALAVAFHYVAITVLPAVLFLSWSALNPGKKNGPPGRRMFTVLALFLLLGIIGYVRVQGWNGWISVLPLFPSFADDGYAIFSVTHLLDFANLLLLIALPALIIIAARGKNSFDNTTAFLFLAALSGFIFACSFNPNLGMGGDWDILATALWPTLILAAWLSAKLPAANHSRIISALAALILLIPVPYLWANLNTTTAITRYESLLKLDPQRAAYGWEKLLVYHESQANLPAAIRAGEQAVALVKNPRLNLKLADTYFRGGKFDDAARQAEIAARANPTYARYLVVVALETGKTGNWRKAREILQTATTCNPADTSISNMLYRFDRDVLGR